MRVFYTPGVGLHFGHGADADARGTARSATIRTAGWVRRRRLAAPDLC